MICASNMIWVQIENQFTDFVLWVNIFELLLNVTDFRYFYKSTGYLSRSIRTYYTLITFSAAEFLSKQSTSGPQPAAPVVPEFLF